MKYLTAIFARLMALWAMISFVLTFIFFFILSLPCWIIREPKGQELFIGIARVWMHIWLRMVGCPPVIKGRHYFQKGKTYIVTFNHNSLMDVPLSCPFVPGANKTIAKSSFTKIPVFGMYYSKGSVLVDRKSEVSRRQSFERMIRTLQKGMHMCIYPEGTRNRTGEPLKKFYDGAFRLAEDTQTDIIPALIFFTKKVLPPEKAFWFMPHRLELHFLPPVSVSGKNYETLREEVYEIMKAYYVGYSKKSIKK
ncbi:MAG: 1-acyl-sn-glycerol-3-phosphate acyltransferase [Chitinophagaceae bacterium]|nr:1-acyl-sn-glycerol-3-phosphate acyltransferase [Chitinophagaceae bacterium]